MTDQEKKRIALAGIAAWLVLFSLTVWWLCEAHALAVQDAGVWAKFCPVMEGKR